ncbi:MAG: glycoside hydrolase family 3 N-terminal domain-containing protein [Cyanobacteria bacterium P01_D01_bin.105]
MIDPRLPSPDTLPLAAQVAQMMVVRTTGHLFDHEVEYPQWEATNAELERYLALGVGGVIFLGGSAAELGVRTQQLQNMAKYPLLTAADIEEGVGQRFSGATWFPPPMALGQIAQQDLERAIALSTRMGATVAQEATAIGLNWILAPVVDVNNNPDNPVINVRAFGGHAERVAQLTRAFIQGTKAFPVLTSAKHFPGHGDTATDSHLSLPVIPHDFERLQRLELLPFREAIAAKTDSVMTAHLQLPNVDPERPTTLSKLTLTGLLRQDMGFQGLIVTDAMVMGAITQAYGNNEAAVMAVEAGADIVMMPGDVEGAIATICNAVETGRISANQILQTVERIWRAKHKVADLLVTDDFSQHAWQHSAVPPIQIDKIATPEGRLLAAEVLQASQQVSNAPAQSLAQAISGPLIPGQNLIMVDELLHAPFLGRTAPAVTIPQRLGYELALVDCRSADVSRFNTDTATLVQLFIRGNPFRSGKGLESIAIQYIKALGSNVQAVVIYGSPYVWKTLQSILPASTPCVFTYGQMKESQAIALAPLLQPESEAVTSVQSADDTFTD